MDDVPFLAVLAVPVCLLAGTPPRQEPALVILADTGRTEGRLPVVAPATDAAEHLRVLSRGLSGRLPWLYQREQDYLRKGGSAPAAPAYLVLTTHQGGFPGTVFVLNGVAQPSAAYVDLHAKQTI